MAFYFIYGKTDFYFVFCNLTASDCGIQMNCKASHIIYSFIVTSFNLALICAPLPFVFLVNKLLLPVVDNREVFYHFVCC